MGLGVGGEGVWEGKVRQSYGSGRLYLLAAPYRIRNLLF